MPQVLPSAGLILPSREKLYKLLDFLGRKRPAMKAERSYTRQKQTPAPACQGCCRVLRNVSLRRVSFNAAASWPE